jgi:hypothetical protein
VAVRVALDGGSVAGLRAVEADLDGDQSLIPGLATGGLHGLPGVAGATPGALAAFARRFPKWAERYAGAWQGAEALDLSEALVEVLRATAVALQDDPTLGPYILEPLEVLGVDAFRDGQVTIRSRLKTQPQRQWDVGREMRRRLRIAFTHAGIDLPPAGLHTVLSQRKA